MSLDDILNEYPEDESDMINYGIHQEDGINKLKSRLSIAELLDWFKPLYALDKYNRIFDHIIRRRQEETGLRHPTLKEYDIIDVIREAEHIVNVYNS